MKKLFAHSSFFIPLLLIHAAYFVASVIVGVITTEDSPEYLFMANNLLNGQLYSWDINVLFEAKFLTLRPPGYSLFILPATLITNSLWAILILQNILSMTTLSGLYFLWRRLLPKLKAERPIIIGLLLFPTGLIYVNMVMAEVLFQALLFWAFYCLVRYVNNGNGRYMLLYNVLVIAALFVKPVLLYFWIPNLLLSGWIAYSKKDWKVAVMPLILPLCAFLYCDYNETRTGYFHFSSIKNINMLNFNARQLLRTQHGQTYADSVVTSIQTEAANLESFAAEYDHMEKKGVEIVKADIMGYAYIHARGMLSFFIDPGRHDIVLFFDIQSEERMGFFNELDRAGMRGVIHYITHVNIGLILLMLLVVLWHIFLVIAWLHTVCFAKNLDFRIRIALFLLVGYVALFSVTIGYARFRVEVYPLLLFGVPFFTEWVMYSFGKRKINAVD